MLPGMRAYHHRMMNIHSGEELSQIQATHKQVRGRTNKALNPWDNTDYDVLILKRSIKSSFMPEAYVFPGGVIDETDMSLQWLDLFKAHGFRKQDLHSLFRFDGDRPYLYSNKSSEHLIPELAFRICALRETFEETGLLLTSFSSSSKAKATPFDKSFTAEEIETWRLKVHKDANQFLNLFHHIGKLPNIWNLYEWMSWLTPTSYGDRKKRFDTAFFITFLDSEIPVLINNSGEAEELIVKTPFDMLKVHYDGKGFIAPPQMLELSRLLNFSNFHSLHNFAKERFCKGMPRWLPVKIVTENGYVVVLPGDDLYPSNPDYIGTSKEVIVITESIEESRKQCNFLNRFEHPLSKPYIYVTNISSEMGHVIPPVINFT